MNPVDEKMRRIVPAHVVEYHARAPLTLQDGCSPIQARAESPGSDVANRRGNRRGIHVHNVLQ